MPLEKQVKTACENLQENPRFQEASKLAFIGHSNGGVVARGVLQNCDFGGRKVKYFVSVGSPQRGITYHRPIERIVGLNALATKLHLWRPMSIMIGPLGYWYDPAPETRGKWTKTNFIVRLNNESPEGGAEDTKIKRYQKDRITALDGMLLIKFRDDEVITPKGS